MNGVGGCLQLRQVERDHDEVYGHDAEEPFDIEVADVERSARRASAEQMAADQVATEHEEQIDTAPAELTDRVEPQTSARTDSASDASSGMIPPRSFEPSGRFLWRQGPPSIRSKSI